MSNITKVCDFDQNFSTQSHLLIYPPYGKNKFYIRQYQKSTLVYGVVDAHKRLEVGLPFFETHGTYVVKQSFFRKKAKY